MSARKYEGGPVEWERQYHVGETRDGERLTVVTQPGIAFVATVSGFGRTHVQLESAELRRLAELCTATADALDQWDAQR